MNWRPVADWAKHRPIALRVADQLGRGRGRFRWFDRINPPPQPRLKPDLGDWEQRDLSAVWLGHASVLLRIGGKTILTDPVLSHRIGLGLGLWTVGRQREVAAALKPSELPPLDLILLSHAHMDHLDRPTLVRLPKQTEVVTASRTADLVHDLGFRSVHELDWNESIQVEGIKLTALPVQHWGARTFHDVYRGYNAYLIEAGGHRVLFGGDSAYQENFRDIGPVDLAIIGIGAYDPYIRSHATPEQAWQMAQHANAKHMLAVHHGTFRLSYEPMDEPMKRLLAAAGADADRVVAREIGAQWNG